MTIPQPLCKFAGLVFCVALSSAISACSSNDDPSPAAGGANTAGSGASAGSNGTVVPTGGTSGAGGANTGSDEVVGTFQVQVQVDQADPTTGMTKVVGQVSDGPVPATLVWTTIKEEGGCRLQTPKAPFCEAGCGSGVCVGDDKCQAYPNGHSVGAVTLSGVKLAGGGAEIALKEIAKAYQPPAGTTLAYPPFALGDDVTVHAAGGDYATFDLAAKGVAPLTLTSTDYELEEDKPLTLTWDAPTDPKSAQVAVKVDISHHGGPKGKIECDVDDTGSLTISATMMTELIGLGVAGYPSVVVMRRSVDSVKLAPGRVQLEVSSRTEQYLTVKGYTSCTVDGDCPSGQACQSTDSTCK